MLTAEYVVPAVSRPDGLVYPGLFLALVANQAVIFTPWKFVKWDEAMVISKKLHQRYGKSWFPLAMKSGSDDFACVEIGIDKRISVVNCHTRQGHEVEAVFSTFADWFTSALIDMVVFFECDNA